MTGGWARPIQRETLHERAYRAVRDALAEGRLRPGEPLPLRPLSIQFDISVTPMREALLRLVSERALATDLRGAVTVPILTRSQIEEIGRIRVDLEGRGAAEAALLATPDDIDALQATQDEVAASHAAADYAGAVRNNSRFHLQLCGLARSPILLELVEALWVRCGPILWHAASAREGRWSAAPHLDAIAALRSRDAPRARAAITHDVTRWVRDYSVFAAEDPVQLNTEPQVSNARNTP